MCNGVWTVRNVFGLLVCHRVWQQVSPFHSLYIYTVAELSCAVEMPNLRLTVIPVDSPIVSYV